MGSSGQEKQLILRMQQYLTVVRYFYICIFQAMKHEVYTFSNDNRLIAEYLKDLNEEEFQLFCQESIYIGHYVSACHAIVILTENTTALKNLISQIISQDEKRKILHAPIMYDQIESSLNTKFFNLLSSFYHFTRYIEASFKKWFGKTSSEVQFIKTKFAEYFDNYFEYRFFYKLRNYVTHCGLPINILFDCTDEEGYLFTQTWYFTKDLLNKYDEWGRVKKDLVERETIMIFPSVFAFDKMKTKLWEDINNFLLERFSKSAYTLDVLLNGIDILDNNKKLSVLSYECEGSETISERLGPIDYKEISLKTYILKLILKKKKSE